MQKAPEPARGRSAETSRKVAKEPKAEKQPKTSHRAAPAGEPKKPSEPKLRPAAAAAGRGIRHFALVVSDQLRQTGIVPFDRLPGLDGRRTRDPDHRHEFHEHRLPGGLTRNVCHGCGHVSIGGSED